MKSAKLTLQSIDDLPDRLRRAAYEREHCVRVWDWAMVLGKDRGIRASDATDHALALLRTFGIEVSRTTLYNWRRAVLHDNLWGLIDQRGLRGRWKQFGRFFLELERLYVGPGLHHAETCHELARRIALSNGWPCPVLRDSVRYLKTYILPGIRAGRGGKVEGRIDGASIDN